MSKLQGAFTALITPFMQDFSVDYEAYKSLVRYQLEGGIDGLLPRHNGRNADLSEEEEEELIILTMKEVEAFIKTGKNKGHCWSRK